MECFDDMWARVALILQTVLLLSAVVTSVMHHDRTAIVLGIATTAGGIAVGVFVMPNFPTFQLVEWWYGAILIICSMVGGIYAAVQSADDIN